MSDTNISERARQLAEELWRIGFESWKKNRVISNYTAIIERHLTAFSNDFWKLHNERCETADKLRDELAAKVKELEASTTQRERLARREIDRLRAQLE